MQVVPHLHDCAGRVAQHPAHVLGRDLSPDDERRVRPQKRVGQFHARHPGPRRPGQQDYAAASRFGAKGRRVISGIPFRSTCSFRISITRDDQR